MIPNSGVKASRRAFLSCAAASVATLALSGAEAQRSVCKVIGFIKPLQKFPPDRIAEVAREAGWDGVEIPVRKGGTIEPERVEDGLPGLAEALKKAGVELSVIA